MKLKCCSTYCQDIKKVSKTNLSLFLSESLKTALVYSLCGQETERKEKKNKTVPTINLIWNQVVLIFSGGR